MKYTDKQDRILDLCLNMLETIAQATDGMEVGDYDYGELYTPHFRYEPSFEFTEDDVKTIKELAEDDCNSDAETLMEWFNNAQEEE